MRKCLSGNALKLIAVVTMTIDHIGAVFFPFELWLRYIGRLAFVIYAFLLVEGYLHTRDVKKYMCRLGIMALISEVPFDLLFHGSVFYLKSQNVYFTLLLGVVALWGADMIRRKINPSQFLSLDLLPVVACCAVAGMIHCDYRYYGIIMIAVFFYTRNNPVIRAAAIFATQAAMNTIQMYGTAALIPIYFYNGQRGSSSKLLKYGFYVYYPLHMLILYVIRVNI